MPAEFFISYKITGTYGDDMRAEVDAVWAVQLARYRREYGKFVPATELTHRYIEADLGAPAYYQWHQRFRVVEEETV